MQPLRGTKDILPEEIQIWQYIYQIADQVLSIANYKEIRTPIIENTNLFERSIGNDTDIVNKEMYSFIDQGNRKITLRPEGTASIARAFIHNKLFINNSIQRLWYLGPMFRYERPQNGRQRQFHQLGIECIGTSNPIADVEVIRLAIHFLNRLENIDNKLEINSIGTIEERHIFQEELKTYLTHHYNDLDEDSKKRLNTNPLRILDSKELKTQMILENAPCITKYLKTESLKHFEEICEHLTHLNISYNINTKLVRGLDYYNYTAFEIKTKNNTQQNTLCGGGRYDNLIQQLGGPKTPSVGWAIGIERLILSLNNTVKSIKRKNIIYIALQNTKTSYNIWNIIELLENNKLNFELDLHSNNLNKQLKKANQLKCQLCFIIGHTDAINNEIIIKWLDTGFQKKLSFNQLKQYLLYIKSFMKT